MPDMTRDGYPVSIPSRGSGKGDNNGRNNAYIKSPAKKFQSPLGEVVKETLNYLRNYRYDPEVVSIPSRGSGKGDSRNCRHDKENVKFQSPLGEVVKETFEGNRWINLSGGFQSPLGEVVKETQNQSYNVDVHGMDSFNPLSGKW